MELFRQSHSAVGACTELGWGAAMSGIGGVIAGAVDEFEVSLIVKPDCAYIYHHKRQGGITHPAPQLLQTNGV